MSDDWPPPLTDRERLQAIAHQRETMAAITRALVHADKVLVRKDRMMTISREAVHLHATFYAMLPGELPRFRRVGRTRAAQEIRKLIKLARKLSDHIDSMHYDSLERFYGSEPGAYPPAIAERLAQMIEAAQRPHTPPDTKGLVNATLQLVDRQCEDPWKRHPIAERAVAESRRQSDSMLGVRFFEQLKSLEEVDAIERALLSQHVHEQWCGIPARRHRPDARCARLVAEHAARTYERLTGRKPTIIVRNGRDGGPFISMLKDLYRTFGIETKKAASQARVVLYGGLPRTRSRAVARSAGGAALPERKRA